MKLIFIAIVTVLVLSACGNDNNGSSSSGAGISAPSTPNGVYISEGGKHRLTFTSDGKVRTVQFGRDLETTYKVDGNTIRFQFPPDGLPIKCTINSDGSILNETTGLRYTKSN